MIEPTWTRLYARGFFLGRTQVSFLDDLDHYRRYELTDYTFYAAEITEIGVATAGDDWLAPSANCCRYQPASLNPAEPRLLTSCLECSSATDSAV